MTTTKRTTRYALRNDHLGGPGDTKNLEDLEPEDLEDDEEDWEDDEEDWEDDEDEDEEAEWEDEDFEEESAEEG
jgi:hypothetical protein